MPEMTDNIYYKNNFLFFQINSPTLEMGFLRDTSARLSQLHKKQQYSKCSIRNLSTLLQS